MAASTFRAFLAVTKGDGRAARRHHPAPRRPAPTVRSSRSTGRASTTRTPWRPRPPGGWRASRRWSPAIDLAGVLLEATPATCPPAPRSSPTGTRSACRATVGSPSLARVPADWLVPCPVRSDACATRWSSAPPASPPRCRSSPSRTTGYGPGDGPVLVTGATGGVGSVAVNLLAQRGYEVMASSGKADADGVPAWPRRQGGHRSQHPQPAGRASRSSRRCGPRPSTASAASPSPTS